MAENKGIIRLFNRNTLFLTVPRQSVRHSLGGERVWTGRESGVVAPDCNQGLLRNQGLRKQPLADRFVIYF